MIQIKEIGLRWNTHIKCKWRKLNKIIDKWKAYKDGGTLDTRVHNYECKNRISCWHIYFTTPKQQYNFLWMSFALFLCSNNGMKNLNEFFQPIYNWTSTILFCVWIEINGERKWMNFSFKSKIKKKKIYAIYKAGCSKSRQCEILWTPDI